MPSRIEDYGLLGDCETAALVSRNGSIDWLCWPRFDSPACFAALLGEPDHGRWLVAPVDDEVKVSRSYRPGTLVLETRFETADGAVTLIDFMPPRSGNADLVRIVRGERGCVRMGTELIIRFDYGSTVPWIRRLGDGRLSAVAGPDMLLLRTSGVELHGKGLTTVGTFTVSAGETVTFDLTHGPSYRPLPPSIDPFQALDNTEQFWREWSGQCRYSGPYTDLVQRSLITLKALTYRHTGGMVAAPTTSLPEKLGGQRNWDYRFCWLRDSAFTLLALLDAGFVEEAGHWRDWLLRAVAGSPSQLQIMYGLAGERRLPEWAVPWLPGYEQAAPVRIGNAAADQLQLDVFGEIMDVLFQAREAGLKGDADGWALARAMLSQLETSWREPDEGIWEVRSGRRHFTHSKLMAWVAFDRGVRAVETFKLEGPAERWRAIRDEIHHEICSRAYDRSRGVFVQSYDTSALDAAVLQMPLVGFLPARDPRMLRTVDAIARELSRDGLLLRYDTGVTDDGLPPGEGTFLACSFWLIDNLILQDRLAEAEDLFRHLIGLCNDLGLLAEMYDPASRRQLGNFPQAFSHVGLVNTAINLSQVKNRPAQQRSNAGNVLATETAYPGR